MQHYFCSLFCFGIFFWNNRFYEYEEQMDYFPPKPTLSRSKRRKRLKKRLATKKENEPYLVNNFYESMF